MAKWIPKVLDRSIIFVWNFRAKSQILRKLGHSKFWTILNILTLISRIFFSRKHSFLSQEAKHENSFLLSKKIVIYSVPSHPTTCRVQSHARGKTEQVHDILFYFLFIYYIFFNTWVLTKLKYKGLRIQINFEISLHIASTSVLIITCPIWSRSPLLQKIQKASNIKRTDWIKTNLIKNKSQ